MAYDNTRIEVHSLSFNFVLNFYNEKYPDTQNPLPDLGFWDRHLGRCDNEKYLNLGIYPKITSIGNKT